MVAKKEKFKRFKLWALKMKLRTGIKVGNLLIEYKLEDRELINEVLIRLKDCGDNEDKLKRFENEIICRQFLKEELVWVWDFNKGFKNTREYIELDFEKRMGIHINIFLDKSPFKFSDEVWVCYDEVAPYPNIIVVGKTIVEQDNFIVVRDKHRKKYFLLKDKTYIVKSSSNKDVLTQAVLEKLK